MWLAIVILLSLVSHLYAGEAALSAHGPDDPVPYNAPLSWEDYRPPESMSFTEDYAAFWKTINSPYPTFLKEHCEEKKPAEAADNRTATTVVPDPTANITVIVPDLATFPPGTTHLCPCPEKTFTIWLSASAVDTTTARIIAPGVMAPPDDGRCSEPVADKLTFSGIMPDQVKDLLGECVYNKLYKTE